MSNCDDCASVTESSHDDDEQLPFALVELTTKEDDENAAVPSRAAPVPPAPPSFVYGKVLHDSQHVVLRTTPSKKSSFNGQASSSQLSSSSLPPPMVTSSILSSPTTVDGETASHHQYSSSYFGNTSSSSLLLPSSHYLDAAASLLLPHNSGSSILARLSSRNSSNSFSVAHDSATSLLDDDYQCTNSAGAQSFHADTNNYNNSHAQSVAFSQLLHQAEISSSHSNVATPATHHHSARPRSSGGGTSSTAYLPPLLEEASFAAATHTSSALSSSSYFTLPDDAYSSYQERRLHEQPQHGMKTKAEATNHNDIGHDKNGQDLHRGGGNWFSRNLFSLSPDDPLSPLQQQQDHQLQQTIVPEASDASILREHNRHQHRLRRQQQQSFQRNPCGGVGGGPPRRLASLAGATARMTGALSFDVSIDLVVPNCTVQDVMDIVGNPDMLPMWCDAVSSFLVITSISEGAQDAANRRRRIIRCADDDVAFNEQGNNNANQQQQQQQQQPRQQESNREYHGEWIEATTTQLMAPVNSSSCIYSTSRMLAVAMGFPTYGKITMFVERHRGHVGLTMGPLPGGHEILHRIKVETISGVDRRIRMTDQVRLQHIDFDSSGANCFNFCDMFSVLERCFLPTPEDYMDQVLNSMARLRFLVENGEDMDRIMPHLHHHAESLQENRGNNMTEPLLSA